MPKGLNRIMTVLAVTQIIGWGSSFYLPGILGRQIGQDLDISSGVVYGGVSVMVITSALLSPRIGKALDRHGTRLFMAAGSVLMAAGLAALAMAQGPITYLAAWAIIGVASVLALALPAMTTLAQAAGGAARRAMVILMLFSGLASSIVWPLTAAIEPMLSWRGVCLLYAAAHLAIGLPLHLFGLSARREDSAPGTHAASVTEGVVAPGRERLVFIAVATAFSLSGFVSWGLSLHVITILETGGLSATAALAWGSALGVMQVSARIVDFLLGSRASPLQVAIIATAALPCSFLLLALTALAPLFAVLFIVAYAVASGLIAVSRVTLPLWLFGAAVYGTASGRLMLAQNVAFGIAPVVFAAVMELGFGYAVGLALLSGLGSLAAIVMVLAAVERRPV
ncbi:MAG: MFS transporter [Hyphomicrobiaceae bacterium]|jgi:predicted MFS family arabinose efflux permease